MPTRYLARNAAGVGTRAERDRLLAEAEVILGGWPFPLDLRARAPRLKSFHQRPAGASNFRRSDLWGSNVIVTTSRGAGNTLGMAEYAGSDFVVICCQWTPETTRLFSRDRFAAMKPAGQLSSAARSLK